MDEMIESSGIVIVGGRLLYASFGLALVRIDGLATGGFGAGGFGLTSIVLYFL